MASVRRLSFVAGLLANTAQALKQTRPSTHCTSANEWEDFDWGLKPDKPYRAEICHGDMSEVKQDVEVPLAPEQFQVCGKAPDSPRQHELVGTDKGDNVSYTVSMSCSCCNGGYDNRCHKGGCVCGQQSKPMQHVKSDLAKSLKGSWFSQKDALALFGGRRILFVGDPSMRRLMFATCAFLDGTTFVDTGRQVSHATPADMKCLPQTKALDDHGVSLEFLSAPSVDEFMDKVGSRAGERWDLVVTSLFHWDRLHGTRNMQSFVDKLSAAVSWPMRSKRSKWTPILLMTPGLVYGNTAVNEAIMKYVQMVTQPGLFDASRVAVSDSSSWMRAGEGSFERDACLGPTSGKGGIHVNTNFAMSLGVQQMMGKVSKILDYGEMDSWGKVGMHWGRYMKAVPWLKYETPEPNLKKQ